MSKYCVCCQKEASQPLTPQLLFMSLVADYDGATLMSEMMMPVMMAIIITLKIMVMTMGIKTLEAFSRIFIVWSYKTDSLHPFLLPCWKEYLLLLMSPKRRHHICVRWILKKGLVWWYEKSLSESCFFKWGFISVSRKEISTFSKRNSLFVADSSTCISCCDTFTFNHFNKRKSIFYWRGASWSPARLVPSLNLSARKMASQSYFSFVSGRYLRRQKQANAAWTTGTASALPQIFIRGSFLIFSCRQIIRRPSTSFIRLSASKYECQQPAPVNKQHTTQSGRLRIALQN